MAIAAPKRIWKSGKLVRLYPVCATAPKTAKVAKLKTARRKLPSQMFAIPEARSYPIHDAYHATLALSFLLRTAGRHGAQPHAARKVLGAVKRNWPGVYSCERDLVAKIKRAHGVR